MKYLIVEWHYKLECPYCFRFEKYVLNPLEEMGYVKVKRRLVYGNGSGTEISRNKYISRIFSGVARIEAPLLIDELTYSVFIPIAPHPNASVNEAVKVMAENFIDHLSKILNIDKRSIISNVRIRKALLMGDLR